MSVEFTYYGDEPILTVRFCPPHNAVEDMREMNNEVKRLVDQMGRLVYVIADIADVEINFSNLVAGLGEVRSEVSRDLKDETVIYLVGAGRMIENIMKFARQDQYGNQNYRVAESIDAALQHIRDTQNMTP
jgi:hypothetical protein